MKSLDANKSRHVPHQTAMKKLLIILAIGFIGYVLFIPTIYQQKQAELEALGLNVDIMSSDANNNQND